VTAWSMVTGASSGIGLAVTERLLDEGRPVVALARRSDRLAELGARHGSRLRVERVDVREAKAVAELVDDLAEDGVGLLVNNAGLSLGLGSTAEGQVEDWQTMIDTNITGLLHCVRAVLPLMQTAGAGHIVNIGSLAAEHAFYGGNVYASSKAFVHHLSASMRADVQGTGVRVTCVAPGMVRTEFALVRFKGDQARADGLYEGIRPLSAADVADTVLWAVRTPQHVNVNYIELMSVDQPFGLALSRKAMRKEVS
jgi:3-hydroxy acid dehydrogenase / malonic semialdehyde reductase